MNQHHIHPFAEYPEDQKIDYLCIVASIASADGKVTDDELTGIREFCGCIEIGELGIGVIMSTIEVPALLDVQATLKRLANTELKFTLVTDMIAMAYADGIMSPSEQEEIHRIARLLTVTPKQTAAINAYLKAKFLRTPSDAAAAALFKHEIPLHTVTLSDSFPRHQCLREKENFMPGIGLAFLLGFGSYNDLRGLLNKICGLEADSEPHV